MITINKEKEKVILNVSMSIGWNIDFTVTRHGEMDAILLRNQIQDDLCKTIEQIRREAYELGWKHAKSKKTPKKDWFNGNINSEHT